MDSLNETRSLFYINVHEVKKALINLEISPVSRVHLTVLVIIENIYICCIASARSRVLKLCKVFAFKMSWLS